MVRFVIAFVIVFAFLYGGLLALRRMRVPVPPQDVIDRVKIRESEMEAKDRAGKDD
ncbi:MAG: hypothetical protein ABI859_05580 [Pseudomonadota bacterium]